MLGRRITVGSAAVAIVLASSAMTVQANAAGSVEPLFPRLDETTAWPDGVLPLDDGSTAFYLVKAIRESPFSWYVGSVGLGRVAASSTT